jgi:hypothetical protein
LNNMIVVRQREHGLPLQQKDLFRCASHYQSFPLLQSDILSF